MKKILIISLLTLICFSLFASGSVETDNGKPKIAVVIIEGQEVRIRCTNCYISEDETWGQYTYKITCYLNKKRVFVGHSRKSICAYFEEE